MEENSGAAEITRENEVKSVENEVVKNGEEENNNNTNNNSVGETTSAEFCSNLGGNRWPEKETMALIEIRSALDVAFRDSATKSPLWEEISRRMAALGYRRSAHKCKEKFENIFKYHKRLKNGSSARPTAKTYRFYSYLEALDHHQIALKSSSPEQTGNSMKDATIDAIPISCNPPYVPQMTNPISVNLDFSPITTSSSTPSSSGSQSETARKRKRKWADLFDKLMKSVLAKQEELQNKLLEAIDKFEQERLAREVEWKMQEIERIKKQHELLIQERSISAAKDAAVLAFLQKLSEQGNFSGMLGQMDEFLKSEPSIVGKKEKDDGENSNRWPKEEVEALIRIKTSMELQNQRMGPLWEDISTGMKNIGYDRNAKKCKEKWENINKYYRRVKDSHRQRPVDSKTCPYFHLLDSLYGMRTKRVVDPDYENSGSSSRPEELLMHMMNVAPSQNGNQKSENHNNEAEDDGNEDDNDGNDYESIPNVGSPTRV